MGHWTPTGVEPKAYDDDDDDDDDECFCGCYCYFTQACFSAFKALFIRSGYFYSAHAGPLHATQIRGVLDRSRPPDMGGRGVSMKYYYIQ